MHFKLNPTFSYNFHRLSIGPLLFIRDGEGRYEVKVSLCMLAMGWRRLSRHRVKITDATLLDMDYLLIDLNVRSSWLLQWDRSCSTMSDM